MQRRPPTPHATSMELLLSDSAFRYLSAVTTRTYAASSIEASCAIGRRVITPIANHFIQVRPG